ncbi:MAG TPA: hypothetical protein VMR52_02565 [Dehalococcoidia bacterium]|nr:hypothetical protein [Dehalococcoidia bacterium]
MFSRFRLLAVGLVVLLVAVIGVAAAACGDDDDADAQDGVTQEQLDEVALETQRAQVLATMTAFRVEGLHEIDDAAQRASEFEAGWSGAITRMRQAVQGTNWPEALHAGAEETEAALISAEEAIADEDLAAFKTAAADAHAGWHGLERDAYSFVAGEEHSGDDGHDDEGDDHGTDEADDHGDETENDHGDEGNDAGMHSVIELTDAGALPTVQLVVHEDAKAGWNLQIVTTNWDWAPEHASTDHVAGEGHAHIYVDGVKQGRVYGDWYHLAALDDGDHEVMITLNANDHSDLSYNGTMIAASQMVYVEAS